MLKLAGFYKGKNEEDRMGHRDVVRNKGKLSDISYLVADEDADDPVLDITHIFDMIFSFIIAFAAKDFFYIFWDSISESLGIKSLVISYFIRVIIVVVLYMILYNYITTCKLKKT